MNPHKASALKHYEGQIKRLFGYKTIRIAACYTKHGATRADKPSGATRRRNAKGAWCLQAAQHNGRVPRGNPRNPTAL